MVGINTSKRGGKAHFYRLGLIEGLAGRIPLSRRGRAAQWPAWAWNAYNDGHLDGQHQLFIKNCVHEPWPRRNNRGDPVCFHCGMRMRALRRRKA